MNPDDIQRKLVRLNLDPDEHNKVKLGDFVISFYHYYYTVEGLVPLNVANELYRNRIGRTDIRVAGHCGCPPPRKWQEKFKDGKRAITQKEYEKILGFECGKNWKETVESKYVSLSDEEYEAAPSYITSYHIDSELGMYIFLQTLSKYNIITWTA